MENLCIECGKNPIHIKKRKLCKLCYQRYWHTHVAISDTYPSNYSKHKERKAKQASEIEFIKKFFYHKNWIFHPCSFQVNGHLYHPDCYDGERNVFIEVSGTSQAFYQNREKYIQFIKAYPKISFEIRYSSGELLKDMKYHIPEKR